MKKFMGIQNRVAKVLAVVILSVLSLCCFVLGFSGLSSKLNTTDAKATGLRAWYRFDVAENFGKDYASQAGTYTLTVNNSNSFNESYNGMRFVPTTNDEGRSSLYAKTTVADPFYNLDTTSGVSISTILYLGGPSAGGEGRIISNSNYGRKFEVGYSNGDLLVYLGGVRVATWANTTTYNIGTEANPNVVTHPEEIVAIPNGEGVYGWYRLTIICNGTAATIKLRDVSTEKIIAPTVMASGATLITSTQAEGTDDYYFNNNSVKYTLSSTTALASQLEYGTYGGVANTHMGTCAFAINGKAYNYNIYHANNPGVGCGGTNIRVPVEEEDKEMYGIKIGDLRIYNGAMSAGEENLIAKGDRTRANSMKLVSAYETDSYYNWDGDSWELDNHAEPTNSIAYDTTRYASLQRNVDVNGVATCNTEWDNATMSSWHKGEKSIMHGYGSEEAKFYSQRTGSMKELDYSDYMRKGSFLVAMRAYVCIGQGIYNSSGDNVGSAYYLLNTGTYSNGFSIQVNWGQIKASFSRRDCPEDNVDSVTLATTNFGLTSTYEWVNIIAYSTGSHVFLCAKKDRDANWTTVSTLDAAFDTNGDGIGDGYAGANFGGFGYSLTLGGQSNFGGDATNMCYVTGNSTADQTGSTITRNQVRLRSTKIYAGVITDENIANVKTDLDNLITIDGTSKDGSAGNEATLEAHYKFDGKSTIGADLSGNEYHLVNPGNMAYSAEDGGLVLDYNNSTNPSENPDHYLYAKRGQKTSSNLDWSDKYTGSFSVAMRVKLSTAEAGRAHKIYSTTRHGGGPDNYTGSHAAYQGNTFEIMINGVVLYFYDVLDATPSWYRIFFCYNDKANQQAYLAIVFKETSAEYFIQQVKTVKDMCDETLATTDVAKTAARNNKTAWTNSDNTDFGGNASYVFTIGAQSTGNLGNCDTGAGSGASYYDPVISEFRFYSGVVDKDDINEILAMDLQEADYALDKDRCSVNMDIGSNMNFNHHMRIQHNLQLSGLKVYYNYNGHTEQNGYAQIVSPVLDKTGDYVSTMSLMAPQDMNDIIQIAKITYDRISVTGEVSFDATKIENNQALVQVLTTETLGLGGWGKVTYSAKQYLNDIILDPEGKYDATAKATAQALLDYGTAAQIYLGHITDASGNVDYINGSGVLDDPAKEQLDWLSNNTVKNLIVESSSSAVQPWVRNIKIDTNLGIGIRYSLPKGYSAEAFTVKVFSGTDISGTPLVESSLSECEKLTNDNWWFDAYQVGYEGVKITRMLDTYTFVVYEEKENGEFEIVSQISMNFAAVLEGYIYSNNLNNVSIAKALLKLYYVANGIA